MSDKHQSGAHPEPAQQELTAEQLDQVVGGRLGAAASLRPATGTPTPTATSGLGGGTIATFGADYSETSNV